MDEDLEYMVYKRLCSQCPNAKMCHEECVTCEQYDKEIANAKGESYAI